MKRNVLIMSLLPIVLLAGCDSSGFKKPNPEEFVNEVAHTASIAVRRYNKKSEVLIGSDATYIYKPTSFNPDEHPDWPVIRATNLSLDEWFEYETGSPYRAIITWTYSHPQFINYKKPASDVLSRATVSFKNEAFPTEVDGQISTMLTGEITFENAKATVSYELILKTLKEGNNE